LRERSSETKTLTKNKKQTAAIFDLSKKFRWEDKNAHQNKISGVQADARGGEGAPPGLAAVSKLLD
jgi:hypothetical protein